MTDDRIPGELAGYLDELVGRLRSVVGDDLAGVWLIGGSAQGAYQHGVSDVDVLAVTRSRWPEESRLVVSERVAHPVLPCPAVGLEFVWYALPDLADLADPVVFQLNVNGGPRRASLVALAPDDGPNYWSVLDLAACRERGLPLGGSSAARDVLPALPPGRVVDAVRESVAWHDGPDAGSPNRVLNLGRMLVLLDDGRWVSKLAGAAEVRARYPALAPALDAALTARAGHGTLDPSLALPLSELVNSRLGPSGPLSAR